MSTRRTVLFVALCILSVIWASYALIGHAVRLDNREIIATIRNGESVPSSQQTMQAIAQYRHALRFAPCHSALHDDLLLLLASNLDAALDTQDIAREDKAFQSMEDAYIDRLSCMPRDGKVWLDFATIIAYREGISPRVLASYRHSAAVTPSESWLAQKRLMFALTLQPLMGDAERLVALRDITVLERAHPNWMNAVLASAQFASADALKQHFVAP